jgi:hypothetical protein
MNVYTWADKIVMGICLFWIVMLGAVLPLLLGVSFILNRLGR